MIYITSRQRSFGRNPNEWKNLLTGEPVLNERVSRGTARTITRAVNEVPQEFLKQINVPAMIAALKKYNEKYKKLHETPKKLMYTHFEIPKKTGGMRPIDAPNPELQYALKELRDLLTDGFGLLYHASSYAYAKKRNTKQLVEKHQRNKSQWFLKTDFSGFFPSTSLNFAMRMLGMIFPTSEIVKEPEGEAELRKALSLGFLNGGLPQGTKLSPTLTGILMIPIDYTLSKYAAEHKMVYTRYADDIHISAVEHFYYKAVVDQIRQTLNEFGAPYVLKTEKTHYGSVRGRNWMLGMMLNGENEITIGWRNKEVFRAMTANFIMDYKAGKYWPQEDRDRYLGIASYYRFIEPHFYQNLIEKYDRKFSVKTEEILKMYQTHPSGWIVWKA